MMYFFILVFNIIALLFILAAFYLQSVYKGNRYVKGIPVALVLFIAFINYYLAGQMYQFSNRESDTFYYANFMLLGTVAALTVGAILYYQAIKKNRK